MLPSDWHTDRPAYHFVRLLALDKFLIFLVSIVFAVHILEQGKILGLVVEVGLRQHTVVDKELQVVPLLFISLAVILEDGLQAVAYLLGDVGRDFLHVLVALQVASADVQRNVRRINDAVQQGQEVRHDILHLVGNEYLIAVELDAVALEVKIALDFGNKAHRSD